ncbi:MAG: MFS transporter [Clostridia bacterium]|nr:MFS transporter [Clostridia bacterium]
MNFTPRHTLYASYLGYITQAIINNLPPLLFVTFQTRFHIPLAQISALSTINCLTQICVDFISARYVDKIGYRRAIMFAHISAAAGLILLGVLPFVMPPFAGIVIAMMLNAVGGGLTEVLISPIVESLPGDEKASAMSMLHSFYCWGHMAVVILSTAYFVTIGTAHWQFLPIIWSVVPLFNIWFFSRVPLYVLVAEEERVPLKKLFSAKAFWVLCILMICAGASEQAMSQWSSLFAELGLGVSKTVGDLLGPCAFACFMGTSRLIYGKTGEKLPLRAAIAGSAVLCIAAYILTVFAPNPFLSLIGCAVCGFSVGIFWPGTFSLASSIYPAGGTAMFAILALMGDVGCGGGPTLVGMISDAAENGAFGFLKGLIPAGGTENSMKIGMLIAMIFPLVLFAGVTGIRKRKTK